MNIEFDKIIEKANARKDKLIEITDLLADADYQVKNLVEAIAWVDSLRKAFVSLDQEGRDLLPRPINNTLSAIDYIRTRLYEAHRHPNGFGLVFLTEPK